MTPPAGGAAGAAKTVLLTGSTGVIGRAIALGLADRNCSLILAVRDTAKGQALASEIRARCPHAPAPALEQVDLGSVASVRRFVKAVETNYPRLDVLINNGAVVAPTRTLTAEGLELQFAVNILSYFLIMVGLASLLKRSGPGARVINVASNLAGDLEVDDLQFARRDYDAMTAYKQAKQANRMLTWHAASAVFGGKGESGGARAGSVGCHAMHPGVTTSNILTGLGYEKGWDTDEKCAATAIFLAMDGGEAGTGTGKYWQDCQEKPCEWQGTAEANAALWARCAAVAAEVGTEEKQ